MSPFATPAGRSLALAPAAWCSTPRFEGDPTWSMKHEVFRLAGGEATLAGTIFWGPKYGTPERFYGSLSQLRWTVPGYSSSPEALLGGFDTGPCDTLEDALLAWGRSADHVLDWAERRQVQAATPPA